MKFKKVLSSLMVGVLCTSMLAGCGNKSSDSSDKTVVDVFQFKVEFKDAFQKLAKDYEKEHPDVKINVTTVGGGDDYGAALKSKFSSGSEPAIFNVGGPQDVKDWKTKLADLKNTEAAKAAIPTTIEGVKDGDGIFGLPYSQEGYGLIYNKEIFKKAGIDASKIKTFADLKAAVETLDAKKGDLGLDAPMAFPAKETWVTGLHLANVFIAPEFDNNIIKTFESKTIDFKYAKQFKDVLDLQQKYSVQPTNSLDYSQQVEKLFSMGKVAIIQQGNWAYGSIQQVDPELAENIAFLPIPVDGASEGKLPVGVPMYWAVNSTKDEKVQQASKDFLDWIYTSEKGKEYVTNEFKFIPAYEGFDASKLADPLSKQIYQYSEQGNTTGWVFMGYPTDWGMNTVGTNIQKYVAGEMTWDQLIKDSSDAWAKARK